MGNESKYILCKRTLSSYNPSIVCFRHDKYQHVELIIDTKIKRISKQIIIGIGELVNSVIKEEEIK